MYKIKNVLNIRKLPKVELHVHLESCFSEETAKYLAKKNRYFLPESVFDSNGKYNCSDFMEFLKNSDLVARVIQKPEDYELITYEYLKESSEQSVIYTELMVCPDYAFIAGITYKEMIEGITKGINRAEKDFGVISRIILLVIRHFGLETASSLLTKCMEYDHPYVVGVTLAGDETKYNVSDFSHVFKAFYKQGIKCTPHAGEISGPESIEEVLKYYPVSRIGHGVRSIEDTKLIKSIIRKGIALEVCPTSNLKLGVYKTYKDHPLRKLHDLGVKVTLNSDDPPFFRTSINNEYFIAHTAFGFSENELLEITKNGIRYSFLDHRTKQMLLSKL